MLRDRKVQMQARAQRLASIHGPFVRFFPDGNEGEGEDDDALNKAIETGEKASKSSEEQAAIDKARLSEQQLEQEQSNTRRANEATRQAQSSLETAQSEIGGLKQQLEAAEAKAAEAGIEDVKLNIEDYTTTDVPLVKAIQALNKKIDAKDKKITNLEKKADSYEQQARVDGAKVARNTAYEELLTDLDSEYGTDCRNEAVKQFNELTAAGKVPKGRPGKATRALEQCYKTVKAAKDKAKAESKKLNLDLDTGSGGGSGVNLKGVEIKEGSLDEVHKQYATASGKKASP